MCKYIENKIEGRVLNYFKKGLLNTIFYGPPKSGKDSLIIRVINTLGKDTNTLVSYDECEIERKGYMNDEVLPFYTTSRYIKFNGRDYIGKVTKLVEFIENISETRNVSNDVKIIYIRNLNLLLDKQEILRQVVEDTFSTCRFIFTVRNIDQVDSALNSRCMSICIPSPSINSLKNFVHQKIPNICDKDCELMIESSMRNMNLLNIIIMYYERFDKISNANKDIAQNIECELNNCDNVSSINNLAERYFTSEVNLLNVCRYLKIDSEEDIIQMIKYGTHDTSSLYKLVLLFYHLKSKTLIQ
tara:strand:+ start:3044 stop:3946 length:903 start_codon:yes stop_codon:yes gene_type:complete